MLTLDGKNIIVTGAAQGIGKAIADFLAKLGANVAICDINDSALKSVENDIKKHGTKCSAYKMDVSVAKDVEDTIKKIINDFGTVDVLVNNAGITRDGLLMRLSEDDWDLVIDVNLKSVYLTSKAIIRSMMKNKGGKIINIASIAGLIGNIGQTNYSASKSGVIGFTKALAKEIAVKNITVNVITPGFIDTEMTRSIPEAAKDRITSDIHLRRSGTPEDIAKGVAFLSSSYSDYITGQVLPIDGGLSLGK